MYLIKLIDRTRQKEIANMIIDKKTSLRMRGIGILLICLHNLLHLDTDVLECEFEFYEERALRFVGGLNDGFWKVTEYCFSYMGWYGVTIFLFLSGYGLACKYEAAEGTLKPWPYLCHHFKKLLLLLLPAYFFFILDYFPKGIMSAGDIIAQLTLTINLFDARAITPGIYWYFGVAMQLYIFYLLFYYKRSENLLLVLSALSLLAGCYFACNEQLSEAHYQIRHNFPLWLSVFTFGIWMARHSSTPLLRKMNQHWLLSVAGLTLLWLLSSVWSWLWVLSPLFAVSATLLLSRHCKSGAIAWVGGISAGIFVCHPILRMFALKGFEHGMNRLLVCSLYVALSILTGWIYTHLYKKASRKTEARQ